MAGAFDPNAFRTKRPGQRFNMLTLVRKVPPIETKKGNYKLSAWLVRCDCGTEKVMISSNIGGTKSCGCWRREASFARERRRQHFDYNAMWRAYRRNAKTRGFCWELTKENFGSLVTSDCFYCGQIPQYRLHFGRELYANGVDRVNNSEGYILTNVVPCCSQCNRAKSKISKEEFIEWALRLAEHQKGGSHESDVLHV